MFTILIVNQKGGVGKTTIADELAFALERKNKKVNFVSTDPQGGCVHEVDSQDKDAEFQIVDTAGFLTESLSDWCKEADMVVIPMLSSSRDLEPTLRTYELATTSKTKAPIGFVINGYYSRGVLDRELKEHLTDQKYLVWTQIPRTVGLSHAATRGTSIAEYDTRNPAVAAFDDFATIVIAEKKKANA